MRIDAHQHFWQLARPDYTWLGKPGLAALRCDFMPADLAPLLEASGVGGTVVVQAAKTREETLFLLELAKQTEWVLGVVGWLDFQDRRFPSWLDQLLDDDKLVGLRMMLQEEIDPKFILDSRVRQNLLALAQREVPLDLLVTPMHLNHVAACLESLPDLRVVIDHCAKPNPRNSLSAWRSDMAELAQLPNVSCKLSGLLTEVRAERAGADLSDIGRFVCEQFGERRLLFGSDWPVCTLAASYETAVESMAGLATEMLGPQAEQRVFCDNAREFYQLPPEQG